MNRAKTTKYLFKKINEDLYVQRNIPCSMLTLPKLNIQIDLMQFQSRSNNIFYTYKTAESKNLYRKAKELKQPKQS